MLRVIMVLRVPEGDIRVPEGDIRVPEGDSREDSRTRKGQIAN